MGGIGKRFSDAGYLTPKPMIGVDGEPMFIKALESFPSDWDIENIFVVRADQNKRYELERFITNRYPTAKIIKLPHDTRGAVETCLIAQDLVDPKKPLIVADCDIRFSSKDYVKKIESGIYDGVIAGFQSSDPRYSYAEIDADGKVIRTAEKNPISNHAILGGYFFGSGEVFLEAANVFIENGLSNGLKEYYLSHLYNIMLSKGKHIAFAKADTFDIWGTPEELKAYLEGKGSERCR